MLEQPAPLVAMGNKSRRANQPHRHPRLRGDDGASFWVLSENREQQSCSLLQDWLRLACHHHGVDVVVG